jgi:charged multivesicular body protein 2A
MAKPIPLKDQIKENQRMIRKAVRDLEREIEKMKANQKKLEKDIKKYAKENQTATVKIMVKDLVRNKNYVNRFIMMKTQLTAVGLKIQTIKSNEAMSSAMKDVTKCLVLLNKQMSVPELQRVMNEFMSEQEKNDIQQEIMNDTMDEAMMEDDSEQQEDAIYNQVMDELGLQFGEEVPSAPSSVVAGTKAVEAEQLPVPAGGPSGGNKHKGGDDTKGGENEGGEAPGGGGGDPGISELEARLQNLRR